MVEERAERRCPPQKSHEFNSWKLRISGFVHHLSPQSKRIQKCRAWCCLAKLGGAPDLLGESEATETSESDASGSSSRLVSLSSSLDLPLVKNSWMKARKKGQFPEFSLHGWNMRPYPTCFLYGLFRNTFMYCIYCNVLLMQSDKTKLPRDLQLLFLDTLLKTCWLWVSESGHNHWLYWMLL